MECEDCGIMDTVGGLLGDKPLICGGGSMFAHHKCSVIGTGDNIAIEMTEARYWAAGATWNNEFFVISGGKDDRSQWLNSTELISLNEINNQTTKVEDMPVKTHGHSMVAINGPPLAQARRYHASALLGQHVVTAGGANVKTRTRLTTPVYIAQEKGHLELVSLLLDRGAPQVT